MSDTVWKAPLQLRESQDVEMPFGARILHVAEQHGAIVLWFLCDPLAPPETRAIAMCGTGHQAPAGALYLGTAMLGQGMLVMHVFETGKS